MKANVRSMVGVVICAGALLTLAFVLRRAHIQLGIEFGHDETEYVATARDFLRNGAFTQSISNRAFGYYLPIGYPFLIAMLELASGFGLEKSAVAVSLAFGVALPPLLALLVFRISANKVAACVAGLISTVSFPLVRFSSVAFSESVFITLFVVLALAAQETLGTRRANRFVTCSGLTGVAFAGAFAVRTAALPLAIVVPALFWLVYAFGLTSHSRKTILLGIGAFVLTASAAIGMNSYRLYSYNGYFTLTPQIAVNTAVGNFITDADLNAMKLAEPGIEPRMQVDARGVVLGGLLVDPARRLVLFARNFSVNLAFLWEALKSYAPNMNAVLPPAFGLALGAAFTARLRNRRRLGKSDSEGEIDAHRTALRGLVVVAFLAVSHLALYSLFMPWRRYVEQALPLVIALGILAVHLAAGRQPSTAQRLAAFLPLVIAAGFIAAWATLPKIEERRAAVATSEKGAIAAASLQMKALAAERGEEVRGAVMTQSILYEAEGYAYFLPWPEENPRRLATYFRHHRINFVATLAEVNFGEGVEGRIGIPVWHLLELLVSVKSPAVERHARFYWIRHPEFPAIGNEVAVTPPAIAQLEPARTYLVLAERDATDQAAVTFAAEPGLTLSGGSGTVPVSTLPSSQWFVLGSRDGGRVAYQYLYFSTAGLQTPMLATTDKAVRKFSTFVVE